MVEFFYSLKTRGRGKFDLILMQNVEYEFRKVLSHHYLPAVRTSTVATASKK